MFCSLHFNIQCSSDFLMAGFGNISACWGISGRCCNNRYSTRRCSVKKLCKISLKPLRIALANGVFINGMEAKVCNFNEKWISSRSSDQWYSVKKSVPRNFANFAEKHLRWSLFLTLLKTRLQHRCFIVKFEKFLRTPIWRTFANECF